MMLTPETIAAVAVTALILGIAMASGRQRNALRNRVGSHPISWFPAARGIPEVQERLGCGSHTAHRGAPHPRPTITERQAREYRAASERFPGYAPSERGQWDAQHYERPTRTPVTERGPQ